MIECDGMGSANISNYANENCLGDPVSSVPLEIYFNDYPDYSFQVTCCTGNQCEIGTRIDYMTLNCSEDSPIDPDVPSYDESPNIIGACRSEVSGDI